MKSLLVAGLIGVVKAQDGSQCSPDFLAQVRDLRASVHVVALLCSMANALRLSPSVLLPPLLAKIS